MIEFEHLSAVRKKREKQSETYSLTASSIRSFNKDMFWMRKSSIKRKCTVFFMIFKIEHPKENAVNLMRRAGYAFQRQENMEMSFVRPLSQQGFPRFHVYTHMEKTALVISMHLDQKRETYGETTRHHGEYSEDGPLSDEARRVQSLLKKDDAPAFEFEP